MIDCQAIEHAALACWPARETENHQGWWLRASDGVTKRANSVTVLAPAGAEQAARIAHCEAFYRTRGLPCIVRLPSFVDHAGLDEQLAARGYRFMDLSLVLHRPLDPAPANPALADLDCQLLDREAWLDRFAALASLDDASRAGQAAILARMPGQVLYAVLVDQGELVSAGLGVCHEASLGIFDVVSRVDRRRQGYGSRLISWMLTRALEAGARQSYLQVVGANTSAIAVYERLGYRRIYDYWYRIGGQ